MDAPQQWIRLHSFVLCVQCRWAAKNSALSVKMVVSITISRCVSNFVFLWYADLSWRSHLFTVGAVFTREDSVTVTFGLDTTNTTAIDIEREFSAVFSMQCYATIAEIGRLSGAMTISIGENLKVECTSHDGMHCMIYIAPTQFDGGQPNWLDTNSHMHTLSIARRAFVLIYAKDAVLCTNAIKLLDFFVSSRPEISNKTTPEWTEISIFLCNPITSWALTWL